MPDGEDKECSGIEDPEKMSEEEKEDVSQKVGEAIEIGNKKAEEEKAAADAKKTKKGKTAPLSLPVFRLLIYRGLVLPLLFPVLNHNHNVHSIARLKCKQMQYCASYVSHVPL